MTSNTTPEGRCIATTENSSFPAYCVFDNTDSTGWRIPDDYISVLGNDMTGVYVGYVWNDDKPVIKMVIAEVFNDNYALWVPHDCTWQLQGQKDDDSWEDIGSAFTMNSSYDPQKFVIVNSSAYKAHRIICKTSTGNYTYTYTNKYSVHMAEVQFYGREDV